MQVTRQNMTRRSARLVSLLGVAMLAALGLNAAHPAQAQELVTNGGFETGDFTGWALNGSTGMLDNYVGTGFTQSGKYAASLGNVGSDATLAQGIATVAGAAYIFSFYFAGHGDAPSDFRANFGGTKVLSVTNPPLDSTYQPYSSTVVASGSTTYVSFVESDNTSYLHLDGVSVKPNILTVAPEPSPVAPFGLVALFAAGLILKARKRKVVATPTP